MVPPLTSTNPVRCHQFYTIKLKFTKIVFKSKFKIKGHKNPVISTQGHRNTYSNRVTPISDKWFSVILPSHKHTYAHHTHPVHIRDDRSKTKPCFRHFAGVQRNKLHTSEVLLMHETLQ